MNGLWRYCSIILLFVALRTQFVAANDTLSPGASIADGESLISARRSFELGFFSPWNSTLRYVGIWYHDMPEQTVVWVANRNAPIASRNGALSIAVDGNLVILDDRNVSVWTSNVTSVPRNSSARLGDDGNLILSDQERDRTVWESFGEPTDTFLPGMRVEVHSRAGENRAFRSWRSRSDPAFGRYTMGVDPRGSPQIVIWEGERRRWRSGHWNNQIFIGLPNMTATLLYGFKLVPEGDTRFFSYVALDGSDMLRFRIVWNGFEEQLVWDKAARRWNVMQSEPNVNSECELYNRCGDYGVCGSWERPACRCMSGFEPRSSGEWGRGNWTGGCVRRTRLECEMGNATVGDGKEEDGFETVRNVKLPDFADLVVSSTSHESCRDRCLGNCSCSGYAFVGGIGCMVWMGELIDVQRFQRGGNTLNVRLAHSDLGSRGKRNKIIILAVVLSVAGTALLGLFAWLLWRFKLKPKVLPNTPGVKSWMKKKGELPISDTPGKSSELSAELSGAIEAGIDCTQVDGPDLPLFSFNFVANSTDNFSEKNKLGEGGFGDVFKGRLSGGQEIAVKRLSRKSGQGVEEFKNEIILIAKLQHRNLVRLVGYCIQEEEKMLLYEYMPNKSLDFFLFDIEKQAMLDWEKRFNIIEGVARGLLYLHRDSRLRIIHRDLKASNILLDKEMTPKISDFGMARIFGGNQNEQNTNRVVGTYGYMSPEYAMEGLFSVKSDVYSFGVLLLEIISGRKNTSFRGTEYLSLIGYAWHLWNEGKTIELLDPSIAATCTQEEVMRCIQVAVLCVQDSPLYRPTMSSVVLMLESENTNLPVPRQPTYTSMRSRIDVDLFSENQDASVSDITVSMVDGR